MNPPSFFRRKMLHNIKDDIQLRFCHPFFNPFLCTTILLGPLNKTGTSQCSTLWTLELMKKLMFPFDNHIVAFTVQHPSLCS